MNSTDTYHVWRRSDGHVNATTYDPNRLQYPNHAFTVLLVTEDWTEAAARISAERAGNR